MTALGMIEVRGYLGAVSVADTALKAANVTLNNAEVIRGGITTIQLTGDVAAVNAAVEAATQMANILNCLLSSHVIARVDEQTKALMRDPEQTTSQTNSEEIPEETTHQEMNEKETAEATTIEAKIPDQPIIRENVEDEGLKKKLVDKKVSELRTIAYKMNLRSLTKKEIKFATKESLIKAILMESEGSESNWD